MRRAGLFGYLILFMNAQFSGNIGKNCQMFSWSNLTFSSHTPYERVKGLHPDVSLTGCSVETVYSLNRHGTRYTGFETNEKIKSLLLPIRNKVQSSESSLCLLEFIDLKNWQPLNLSAEEALQITDLALIQHYSLGKSWRTIFSQSFRNVKMKYDARCTDADYVKFCAEAFKLGLEGKDYQKDIQPSCPSIPAERDKVLNSVMFCDKYIASKVSDNYSGRSEMAKLMNSNEAKQILSKIASRLGLDAVSESEAIAMFDSCQYESVVRGTSSWCVVLGMEGLNLFSYKRDIEMFWKYSYGEPVNYQPTCPLLDDVFVALLSEATNKTKGDQRNVYVRFAHSRTVLPFITLLGLFKEKLPPYAYSFTHQSNRTWKAAYVDPYGNNILFVLYKCSSSFYVKTFLNERAVQLPGCPSPVCPLDDLILMWLPIVLNCDINKLCQDDTLSPDELRYWRSHLYMI